MPKTHTLSRLTIAGLLLFSSTAFSTTVLQQAWPTLILNKTLTDEFLQNRLNLENGDVQVQYYAPSLGYKIQPNLTIWNGYLWTDFTVDEDSLLAGQEQRIWQRLDWVIAEKQNWILTSLTRMEERTEEAFSEWAYRLRERIQLNFPQKLFSYATPIVADEVFFNLNQPPWVPQTTLQQNRFYLGLSVPMGKYMAVEGGYLNQYQIFPGSPNTMTNVVYGSLTVNL